MSNSSTSNQFSFHLSFLGAQGWFEEIAGLPTDEVSVSVSSIGSNLTLKKGTLTDGQGLVDALQGAMGKMVKTFEAMISLQDAQATVLKAWTLTNAWVVKMEFAAEDGEGNLLIVEALELAYDTLTTNDVL